MEILVDCAALCESFAGNRVAGSGDHEESCVLDYCGKPASWSSSVSFRLKGLSSLRINENPKKARRSILKILLATWTRWSNGEL